jgi:penicillin-binding protein 1A
MDNLGNTFQSVCAALGRAANRHIRFVAILISSIAIPGALMVLMPAALEATATPLGLSENFPSQPGSLALTFLDSEGKVIGKQGPVVGQSVRITELPAYLPNAFLAMEDRRFYSHQGMDLLGLSRAAIANMRAGRIVAGGSTVSQQTAKLLFADRDRTFRRKLREMLKTASLERSYTKQQILEIYLNRIYLGQGAYGVDTAARTYFGISARQVSLAQAAMLAGLTRAPTLFSPRRDAVMAQVRAERVLKAMVETGAISPGQAANARLHPAQIVASHHDDHSYVLDAAATEARQLLADKNIEGGSFLVHTTVNSSLQREAEHIVTTTVRQQGHKLGFSQAAAVVMTPDGSISAMVGGLDYGASVFNRVTQAHRQPGSAFKPFVYLAALERGMSPWDWRDDQPVEIQGYHPENYHKEAYGRLQLIDALARSVNTITVNLAQEVGIGNVSAAAHRLGILSPLHDNASLALGTDVVTPLELTAAYAAFANGGVRVYPHLVSRIDRSAEYELVASRALHDRSSVVEDTTRRDLTAMLYAVVQAGTGMGARLPGREAAGKTGTTQKYRDAWFVGFTADNVAGVWIGNDDDSPMRNVTGGTVPAQIWKQLMLVASGGSPPRELDRTQGPPPNLGDLSNDAADSDEALLSTVSAPDAPTADQNSIRLAVKAGNDLSDLPPARQQEPVDTASRRITQVNGRPYPDSDSNSNDGNPTPDRDEQDPHRVPPMTYNEFLNRYSQSQDSGTGIRGSSPAAGSTGQQLP